MGMQGADVCAVHKATRKSGGTPGKYGIMKRKNAKKAEEEKGQNADDTETVNEINAESKTGNEAGNDMPAITEADGIEVQK